MRLRQLGHAVHRIGITGMESGGNIGRTDDFHDLVIRRIAQHPLAKAFAHVAIQIDCFFHARVLLVGQP